MHDLIINPSDYPLNNLGNGHVRIWKTQPESGQSELLVNAKNLIVKQGADVLALALAGKPNAGISHFYIAYSNDSGFTSGPAVTTSSGISSFPSTGTYGYIRIPLAFPASFLGESTYESNAVYFTTFVTSGSQFTDTGAGFANNSKLYSLGLVNGLGATDKLFSKVNFGPIIYDNTHGLAITWGITFRSV